VPAYRRIFSFFLRPAPLPAGRSRPAGSRARSRRRRRSAPRASLHRPAGQRRYRCRRSSPRRRYESRESDRSPESGSAIDPHNPGRHSPRCSRRWTECKQMEQNGSSPCSFRKQFFYVARLFSTHFHPGSKITKKLPPLQQQP